jgi:hypothetical protein
VKVAEMIVEEEGVKKINWRWRRNLFEWEKEMVKVCSDLVLSVKRVDGEGDFGNGTMRTIRLRMRIKC